MNIKSLKHATTYHTSWGLILDLPADVELYLTEACRKCEREREPTFLHCLQCQNVVDREFFCSNVAKIQSFFEKSQ
jgi:hypothetical protein